MRKRFTKQEKLKKEYRELSIKRNLIFKKMLNQPYVDVKPFQKGWNIYITLRGDILRRNDADFLLTLLELGYNKNRYTRSITHIKNIRKGIYYYCGNKFIINLIPERKHFTIKQYNEFSERIKKYFDKFENYGRVYYKINIPYYWIKLNARPNIVTKIRDINPELQSKYDKILNLLKRKCYWKFGVCKDKYWDFNITKTRHFIKHETYKYVQEEITNNYYNVITNIYD